MCPPNDGRFLTSLPSPGGFAHQEPKAPKATGFTRFTPVVGYLRPTMQPYNAVESRQLYAASFHQFLSVSARTSKTRARGAKQPPATARHSKGLPLESVAKIQHNRCHFVSGSDYAQSIATDVFASDGYLGWQTWGAGQGMARR